ncbi:hypothetical protein Tco_0756485 [Tanacetum coccineum]
MSSMQEDIQCAGSDTRPPMLDRTDFESWQQRIRLYCLGKDNGENIMKSIKEGPFHMGTVSDVIRNRGAVSTSSSNARNKAMVQDGKVVVQDVRGRYNATNQGRPFQRNNARGNGVAGNVGAQNRGGMINPGQAKPIKLLQGQDATNVSPGEWSQLDEEQSYFFAGEQFTTCDDVDDSQENDLALNVDHIFEADECDAFDSDVDEGPTSQTMFMANLTSEDPIYDEAGPSYDSNNPFEVQDQSTL